MLVCNVSLRPRRRAIAAELTEVVTATDTLAFGNVVFATLVDDPASVNETVDAYLGEIMLEAASASDALSAGSAFAAALDEVVTATDAADSTTGAISTRSAIVAGPKPVFINPGASREANANGIMVNI